MAVRLIVVPTNFNSAKLLSIGRLRRVGIAFALVAALASLSGCAAGVTTGEDSEVTWESITEDRPFVEFGDPLVGFDRTRIEPARDYRVDTRDAVYRVETVHHSQSIPPQMLEYSALDGYRYGVERPEEGLIAPEGYQFTATVLAIESNWWHPAEQSHPAETSLRIVVKDEDAEHVYPIGQPSNERKILFLTPVDAQPADVTLEVNANGTTQRLSLLDGSRTSTDAEQLYEGLNFVSMNGDVDVYSSAQDSFGNFDVFYAYTQSANIFPSSDRFGWPENGHVFLTVSIIGFQDFSVPGGGASIGGMPIGSDSSFAIRVPDGNTIEPFKTNMETYPGTTEIWFEIPSSLTKAEFVADFVPFPRRDGLAEDMGDITLIEPLVFGYSEDA